MNNNAATAGLPEFTKRMPAREIEPLDGEPELGGDSPGRVRVLGELEARINGELTAISPEMIKAQNFSGLSFVGIAASLCGPHGLSAACAWFDKDCFDWFWVEIVEVVSITVRADPRFRGGALCVWMTTPFAEYALTTVDRKFEDLWESSLGALNAPRCDRWPSGGVRPPWWTAEHARAWPYKQPVGMRYQEMVKDGSLAQMAGSLSLQSNSPRPAWGRLGPKGDTQFPDRPLHNLGQMTEWNLSPDAGLRKTQDPDGDGVEGSSGGKGKGKRTIPGPQQGPKRNTKVRRG
ncbi:hypothetical protein FRC08_006559 [Ceratobasidium sp. 394]|nr:hypothetical protein FRC08_006559 [Ceratobasidium sp. 394]